jgi:thymidylate kinase
MIDTKLIIVEGIMGSGKSTTSEYVSKMLTSRGIKNQLYLETHKPHPLKVLSNDDPQVLWNITPAEYRELSLKKWAQFVENIIRSGAVHVLDGRLYHGSMMFYLLLDPPEDQVVSYVHDVVATIRRLDPVLVYLFQRDVELAVRSIVEKRGQGWFEFQGWKLTGPYSKRKGYVGLDGLIRVHQDKRAITDKVTEELDIRKLCIETSAGVWDDYQQKIIEFLQI